MRGRSCLIPARVSGVHLSAVELHLNAIDVLAKGPSWGDSVRHGLMIEAVV
jgi:hypothetical protein